MTAQAGGASPLSTAVVAPMQWRKALRSELRSKRRALTRDQRRKAALAVAHHLERHWLTKPGLRIGIYLAMRDELHLGPFINLAWSRHCQLFAPLIVHARRRQLSFHSFTAASRLRIHRWGMAQLRDVSRVGIASTSLDVVLVPLVGFDAAGNRLGMGAGFYDRYFAPLGRGRAWRRPKLIGIAYACQQVDCLPIQPHDVPLDAVVTECGWMRATPAKPA